MDKHMIEVTGVSLTKLAQVVYELSRPQGMGYLHFQPGGLSDEDAEAIWKCERPDDHIALSMDYVKGRACKFTVFRESGKLFIRDTWFDHSGDALKELLRRIELAPVAKD